MSDNNNTDIRINSTESGSVCFAPDVLATIAGLSIAEIDGVANTTGLSAMLAEKISKKPTNNIKNITKGIKVEVSEDNQVDVCASVVVEYGHSVPEVAKAIQENIKSKIETMTAMNVKNVDVRVTGLSFAKENKEAAELEFQRYLLGEQTEITEAENEVSNTEDE